MRNKKFVSIVALVLVGIMVLGLVMTGISALAVSQSEIDALEAQRDEIRAQQSDVKEQLDALQNEMASIIDKKAKLDEQNELNRQDIELINEQIELYDLLIAEKIKEVAAAEQKEQEQFELYSAHVRVMEENSNWTYVAILFNATSFTDFLSRLDDVTEIMKADKRIETAYKQATEDLKTVKAEFEQVQAEQKVKRVELLDQKEKLEKAIEEAYLIMVDLEKDIEEYKTAYESNELLEAGVQAQIDAKAAELAEQQRKAEEAARALAAANNTTYTAPAVSGSYIWPSSVTYITSKFGYRVHPIFGTTKYHSGVDIAAAAGSNVNAAMAGTVSIAQYSSSYGNYVVIYHSNGTSTLYGHMSTILVSEGDTVSAGQTVGYCGSTGWATGPHIHFEIRVDGASVDPLSYFPGIAFTYSSDA